MRDCARYEFRLGLYQRARPADTFTRVDTLAAWESGLFVYLHGNRTGSTATSDCASCNTLLSGAKMFSDHDILAGSDTLKANANLLEPSSLSKLGASEEGTLILHPGVKLKRGSNHIRYEADLVLGQEKLLAIRDTLEFWVDSTQGY